MTNRHAEIELKWDADAAKVSATTFNRIMMGKGPVSYTSTHGPDVYYANGDSVVRHRWSASGRGELTVKQRKGKTQIVDRLEVDLRFSIDTKIGDVQAFLDATGFKKVLTLIKEQCHCFQFHNYMVSGASVTMAYYGVEKMGKNGQRKGLRHFIEAEIDKGSNISDEDAKEILASLQKELETGYLGLKSPIQFSLYEIFTGNRYPTAKKGK